MSKKEILKGFRSEFSEYLRPKTIGVFDSILLANEFEEYLSKAIDQTREETISVAMERIEQIKSAVTKNTGSYKYDSCYDDCLNVLQSLINLRKKK